MPSFHDFDLQPTTLAVLAAMHITEPTPIQVEAIPALLAGKDLVGQSATGSGKTLAYGLPLVERIARDKRVVQALILVPTRELALQVNNVLSKLAVQRRLTTALLVGGRAYGSQISALRYGAQIVVGTPGRVKDHLDRGSLVMSHLRMCVLDEADQMLDSGFAPAIEEILATTPETRQMALFSATIPDWVAKLQEKFLKDPLNIAITPAASGPSTIEQIAYQVPQTQKIAALCSLLNSAQGESSLIFGRTKYGVERLGKQLSTLGFTVGTLHGNKSQRAREEVLSAFRRGHVQTLLATNVAARGLDIRGIYQVINYELPESSELFTHRIGRTGRMGQPGKAITLLAPADVAKWRRMANSLGQPVVLQRLALDEGESAGTPLPIKPASADAPQPAGEPKQFLLRRRPERKSADERTQPSAQQQPEPQPTVERRRPVGEQERETTNGRKSSSSGQQRSRVAQPRHASPTPAGLPKRLKGRRDESVSTRARQPKTSFVPARPSASKAQNSRRDVGRPSHFGKGPARSARVAAKGNARARLPFG